MIRHLIFDLDGVVNLTEVFSQQYCREFNIPYEKIFPFFQTDFKPCLIGQADLKEVIKPWLIKWNWSKSTEEFLAYWFKAENHPHHQLLKQIQKWHRQGFNCYLATNNEKYRVEFVAQNIGQPDKQSVFFTDDSEENILAARNFGFIGLVYSDYQSLVQYLNRLLPPRI